MSDRDDWEQATATPVEGVRILGAEEAQAVLASEGRTPAPDALDLGAEEQNDEPSGEAPPLPHWTEPATGTVPAIFTDEGDEVDDDLDAWATDQRQPAALSRRRQRLGGGRLLRGPERRGKHARRAFGGRSGRRGSGVRRGPRRTAQASRTRPRDRALAAKSHARPSADTRIRAGSARAVGGGARPSDRNHDSGCRRDRRVGLFQARNDGDGRPRGAHRGRGRDRVRERAAHEGPSPGNTADVAGERDDTARGQALWA